MKKFALILLMMAGVAACTVNGKKKEETQPKNDTVSLKEKKPAEKNPYVRTKDDLANIPNERNKRIDASSARMAYNKGIDLYKQAKYEDALAQFKTALENSPDNSMVLHYIGRTYYDMGQKTLALSYYEDAARNNIDDSVSVLGIGQIYFEMGNKDKAMEYYNMSIEIGPNFGLAYYNRGTLLGMQKQYEKALDDLNKSIQLDSTNSNAYLNRGLAHYYLKNLDLACRDWQKAADMGLKQAKDAVDMYCKKNPANH